MNTLVIYTSQTGFTRRYAHWLAERLEDAQVLTLDQAKDKDEAFFSPFEALVFGGWAMAGKIQGGDWFLDRLPDWKGKKLALFMVGASPNESPDIPKALDAILNVEQKDQARVFYCQGGLDYNKMPLPSKIIMKVFAAAVKKKEPEMGKMISKSYDIADPKYLDPLLAYLEA